MRKHLSVWLATIILLLAYACTRKDSVTSPDLVAQNEPLTVANVRAWFENRHANDIKAINNLKRAKGGSIRLSSYAKGAFAGVPNWNKSSSYINGNTKSIRIELDYTRAVNDTFSFRELIVAKDKNGRLKEYIQTVEFDPGYYKKQMLFKLPLLSEGKNKNFSGTIRLYNTSNFFIRGAVYKDGKLVARISPKGGFNAGLTSSLGLGTKLLRTYGEIGTEKNPTEEEEVIIEAHRDKEDSEPPYLGPPEDPFPDGVDPSGIDPFPPDNGYYYYDKGGYDNTNPDEENARPGDKLCKNSLYFSEGSDNSYWQTRVEGLIFENTSTQFNVIPTTNVFLANEITAKQMFEKVPGSRDYFSQGETPYYYLSSVFPELIEGKDIVKATNKYGESVYRFNEYAAASIAAYSMNFAGETTAKVGGHGAAAPGNQTAQEAFWSLADQIVRSFMPGSSIREAKETDKGKTSKAKFARDCAYR